MHKIPDPHFPLFKLWVGFIQKVFHKRQNFKILVQSMRMKAVVLANLLGEIGVNFPFLWYSFGYSPSFDEPTVIVCSI
jgi:hypothetical protein